jgi:distribution and morphology protein 10
MHDFVSHVLRKYYAQTDWNPFNSYLHLTSSSSAVLDFAIPTGLSLSISASPSPPFFTTYRLRALPTLSGALGYIYASVEDDNGNSKGIDIGGNSNDIRFKQVVDRFRILETPLQPTGKEEVFQAGKRVDTRDYLLYGCMHVPSSRVDALFTTRLSPTWQLLMTAISTPPRSSSRPTHPHSGSKEASDAGLSASTTQSSSAGALPPGATNLQINLQNDTGRWFTEYSYSVDDGLLGFRVLHNLGQIGRQSEALNAAALNEERAKKEKRVDEESTLESVVGGGLQGRFSVGAELFFSPLEKSAGLSTGMRFTTLPENVPSLASSLSSQASPTSGLMQEGQYQPSQPPTTITATLNPMMGHLSTAYAARMTRDIVACSRFDFNVYSYDSDLTLGAEYWIHSKAASASSIQQDAEGKTDEAIKQNRISEAPIVHAPDRQLQARVDPGLSLRDNTSAPSLIARRDEPKWSLRQDSDEDFTFNIDTTAFPKDAPPIQEQASSSVKTNGDRGSVLGVIKGRLSTSGNVALLWESRLRNCLVSFGIKGDLSSNQGTGLARKPLRGVGLDIIYFTQNRQGE